MRLGSPTLWLRFAIIPSTCLCGFHQLVQLPDLLICGTVSKGRMVYINEHSPLSFSSFSRSILPPLQVFPSTSCAYSCHSVRKAIFRQEMLATAATEFRIHGKFLRTMCTGLSTFRWALNSALTYSSPRRRMSRGRKRRCALRSRL